MNVILCLAVFALVAGSVRATAVAGGWSEAGTNDEGVQQAAAFAAEELNFRLVDVKSAQTQVRNIYLY